MEDFRAAVKKMQRFAGYKETGDISDARTLALVKRKRCGLADLGPSDNAKRKRRWAHQGTSWKKNVSYFLEALFQSFASISSVGGFGDFNADFLVLMLFLAVGIWFNIEWTRFGLNDGSSRRAREGRALRRA